MNKDLKFKLTYVIFVIQIVMIKEQEEPKLLRTFKGHKD